MRIAHRILLTAAALATAALPAAGQTPAPAAGAGQAPAAQAAAGLSDLPAMAGEIEFGARVSSLPDQIGRLQRFVDLRSGPTLDLVRYRRERDTWAFRAEADHVGYRDQHYAADLERYGKLRVAFDWDQVPLLYGTVTETAYREETPAVFRLNDLIQSRIQAGTATIAAYQPEVQSLDLRSRRDTARTGAQYSATRNLDLSVAFTSTARSGAQPWGAGFGFNNTTAVPVPLDHRTNDVTTAAEWSNQRGMARLAYDGSWFNNNLGALVWDNPLRFSDQTYASGYVAGDASSQGRMSLWPDSSAHTVSASGSLALPARTRAFAYVSVGTWLQDDTLLPFTINTAIAPIPLPRATAEAEARVTAMNYRVTSRPTQTLWLTAQFRRYHFDNRTPRFPVTQYVRLDETVSTSATGGSEPFGYERNFVDVDASYTPFRFVAFRAGYGQEHDNRTYRYFEETTDHTGRVSIDSTGLAWGSVRLQYERSERTGKGFDEQALSDIGEQVSLRQFDIANRTRDRVSLITQYLPLDSLGVSATLSTGTENRPESAFGLQDNDVHAATVAVDYTPLPAISAGLSYSFERYSTLQRSRQASPGPQFNDPTRDWSTDMSEDVHTVSGSLELPTLARRTSLRLAYDKVHSNARYLYVLPPVSTLVTPQQLPPVTNDFQFATADLRYTFSRRLALGVGYRLDAYDVDDFALSPRTITSSLMPTFFNVRYQWRPYTVNTGSVRLLYSW